MPKLRTIVTLGTLLLLTGCAANTTNGTPDRAVAASVTSYSPQAAPADVREEFRSRFPHAELTSVQKRTYRDGAAEYEVQYLEGGQNRSALITPRSSP
jgi:hypothetical protein